MDPLLTFDAQGRATAHPFAQESTTNGPVQIVTGPDTNLYWMRYSSGGGEVHRVRYVGAGNTPPVVQAAATPTIGQAPMPVAFSGAGSYDPDAQPYTAAWDFEDGGTSSLPNPSHTVTTEPGRAERQHHRGGPGRPRRRHRLPGLPDRGRRRRAHRHPVHRATAVATARVSGVQLS